MLMNYIHAQLSLHRWADTVGQWGRKVGTRRFVMSTLSGSVYVFTRDPDTKRFTLRQVQGDTLERLWGPLHFTPYLRGGYSDVKSRETVLHLVIEKDGDRQLHTLRTSQVYGVADA